MAMKRVVVAVLLIVGGSCAFGCMTLTSYEREETVRAGEARRCVAFESPAVASGFESAVKDRWAENGGAVKKESFGILFVTCYSKSTSLAESAFYNDQIAACDIDHNGIITEAELKLYQSAPRPTHGTNIQLGSGWKISGPGVGLQNPTSSPTGGPQLPPPKPVEEEKAGDP
jgi:hypothetical protein